MEVLKQSYVKERSYKSTGPEEFMEETPALGKPLKKLSTHVNTVTM